MVPPGTKVIAHSKPGQRASWAEHGEQGWTIGPSLEHYRCIKSYFPKTRSEKDNDTVTFFPHTIKFPEINLDAFLRQAATDIITLLTTPPSTTTLTLKAGDNTNNALLELATILNRASTFPKLVESPLLSTTPTQLCAPTAPSITAPIPRVPVDNSEDPATPPRVPAHLVNTLEPYSKILQRLDNQAKPTKSFATQQSSHNKENSDPQN